MSELNFNFFNLIILSGVVQGIIFSLVVLTQKKYITNNTVYLGLVVLFLSLSNLQYWCIDAHLTKLFPILKLIFIPWHWLVLPMFYLYVYKFIGTKRLKLKTSLLLIAPFFIVLLIHIIYVFYSQSHNNKDEIVSHFERGIYVYIEFLSVLFNISTMVLVYRMILRHENDKSYEITWVKSETNWLKKLIYTGLATCFCWLLALLIVVIYNLNISYIFYPLWVGISILVYWIGYVGLNKSQQLKKRIELRKKRIISFKKRISKKSSLQNSKSFDKIDTVIKIKRMYLNPNMSLHTLSKELNLSEGYISQTINRNIDSNFNDYINSLRINDSKTMLQDHQYNNYTIAAIGLEVGFNSKSSFYTAFKKFTGQTPTTYKKSVRNL